MRPTRSSARSPLCFLLRLASFAEGREAFDNDEYVQLAIVHLVQIIGEAANRLSDALIATHPEVPWRQIVATRNRVVHSYFDVDLDILWTVATVEVTKLAEQIRSLAPERNDP